jgi:hypothetical protein
LHLDYGIELDTGEGRQCRILLPSPGCARVVFNDRSRRYGIHGSNGRSNQGFWP